MPALPFGNYERVLIHDNWMAINRFVESFAGTVRKYILDRYVLYYLTLAGRDIALFATATGSAQTNRLVEILKAAGCRAIVKVGTCSALQPGLEDGDVIVPAQALIDEGATEWRRTKQQHDTGKFNTPKDVLKYVEEEHEYAAPNTNLALALTSVLSHALEKAPRRDCGKCVWSVDSYDCFDGSPALYGQVRGQIYKVSQFPCGTSANIMLAGVEMECSALFSAASALGISAAAVIIVSRRLELLLHDNARQLPNGVPEGLRTAVDKAVTGSKPSRDKHHIQSVELQCIREIVRFLSI